MVEDAMKVGRGRPVTGNAKTSAERSKAADEALVAAGGRVLRARLSPAAAAALATIKASLGSDKDALDAALVFAAENMQLNVGTNNK
jgi:hypothetical protein